uniref:Uncharacterized protein n=1 Tax=Entomoneis paludosa TaxID=265537 RepID=A0A7S2YJD7_9STRA|mmetsp:Transcript_35622/g.74136  ORF Transcript_35622/g.74136 Transcript_35622/m.74136 type:complete len:401 (+) Transcript_35622:224-1426(+)|eukprot:CAMPEP_0172448434 /NCGR_PEP_ID=MMETSP1065-20121228/7457_1 /TAXON_ID=265537 /ORGANISM="Amphiprora paludosa, Strain CCMP125" /LENGTH=400 /DNA_ID=CAMNT_0013199933 /DNA_START=43 /DNA_END=1245 /DNA_ORIENTATION=-
MSGTNPSSPYGYSQPKPKKRMDDDDEDGPSRKVAAGGAGISFAPMAPSFTPVDFASLNARPQKAGILSTAGPTTNAPPKALPFRWKLETVPTLPEFHPLERTAVFCEHTSATEVASRVSSVLRQRSIEASYHDEKARVKCATASGVEFRVRLYRGRNVYSHGIIVEVQRRFGYALDFHEITTAILNAAQGLPAAATPAGNSNTLPLVSDAEDDEDDDAVPPPPSSGGTSSLSMISKMFSHSSGYDSYYLALQTLASLTDASRMGATTARQVSTELLNPDNEVGSKLVDLIVKKPDPEEEQVFPLQVMALTILANALAAVEGQIPEVLYELLRPVLLQELQAANASNLLVAQQAARCLEYTWEEDHAVGELQQALEVAQQVGQARHAGLEKQARKTLSKLV